MTGTGWWSSTLPQGKRRRDASRSQETPNSWAEFRAQLQQRRQSRPPSRLAQLLAKAGWRRTAYVNTFLECVVAIVLMSILISTATQAGSVTKSLVFYEGDCAKTARINVGLHLLINVASTCIVASSNYFMQILSSPTRREVDVAHQKARSLEIGVPSIRNIGHISLRNGILWTLFVVSSVPIHVLFNSIVFETDYQGAGFFMAMATEAFVQSEEEHKGLGASLIYSGAVMNTNFTGAEPSITDPFAEYDDDYFYEVADPIYYYNWGGASNISDYLNDSSPIMQSTASTSKAAKDWTRLNAHDCRAQYGTCTPRRNYGSVVLIMDGQFQKNDSSTTRRADPDAGFVLEDIYDLTREGVFWNKFNLTTDDEVREYWAEFGPIDEPNPLWFAAECNITTNLGASNAQCYHACANPLGLLSENPYMVMTGDEVVNIRETRDSWDIPLRFFNATFPGYHANWTFLDWYGDNFAFTTVEERPVFRSDAIDHDGFMRLTHCYAEPLQPLCKVAMSNELLLIVTIGVLVKVGLSVLTCVLVREVPLVTPGDAMASFIANPDPTTECRAAIGMPYTSRRRKKNREWGTGVSVHVWPDQKPARIAVGIPRATWLRVYALVVCGVIATAVFFSRAILEDPINKQNGTFGHKKDGGAVVRDVFFSNGDFIGKVIFANTPQLILSLCYFAFNALITRACSEMEWNSYATTYKALRVSHPERGQVWTYRLQMPYEYSFPLIVLSVLLHWLVSNTIFVGITEGDYLNADPAVLPGISDHVFVSLGYSSLAILVCLIIFILILFIPLASFMRLQKSMVMCGNNSFAISAACHASTLNAHKGPLVSDDSLEMLPLTPCSPYSAQGLADLSATQAGSPMVNGSLRAGSLRSATSTNEDMKEDDLLRKISRSPVRWGVVQMSPEWAARFGETGQQVEHLTFGTAAQNVEDPEVGKIYA